MSAEESDDKVHESAELLEDSDIEIVDKILKEQNNGVIEIETITISTSERKKVSKATTYRNLVVLSFAFTCNFTAFNSFSNVQSSINKEDGLGTTGLSLIYVVMILANLFLSPVILSKFSYKWIMVFSILTYAVFMATGFYTAWATVVPGSFIIGFGASLLWPSQQSYLTNLARDYGTVKNMDHVIRQFTGIFYAFLYSSQIWGNLVASIVFRKESGNLTADFEVCGAQFCPFDQHKSGAIERPPEHKIFTYTGFCVGMSSLGAIVIALFLTNTNTESDNRDGACKNIRKVGALIVKSRDLKLLIVPAMTSGVLLSFFAADFTAAFVSCPFGVENVGVAVITYGVVLTVFSFINGRLAKVTGQYIIFLIAFIVFISVLITLRLFQLDGDSLPVALVLASLYGLAMSANEPAIAMLVSVHFREDVTVALSSTKAMSSVGWAASFAYSNWLCMEYKIYIVMVLYTLSFVSISTLQLRHRKSDKLYRTCCVTSTSEQTEECIKVSI
ncbi:protein unc-93 homolog A-like [Mya arenaria]|uniref:protein unc-93 homolog A-like n=1 Tax=Mya arenaria TaxID=6604 RepID=UPI0022E59C07|nr:protein unc-93 homolog A-like [Mya arenaria]